MPITNERLTREITAQAEQFDEIFANDGQRPLRDSASHTVQSCSGVGRSHSCAAQRLLPAGQRLPA